eukprot:6903577-Alexandrium_andersonii.AAC.1
MRRSFSCVAGERDGLFPLLVHLPDLDGVNNPPLRRRHSAGCLAASGALTASSAFVAGHGQATPRRSWAG